MIGNYASTGKDASLIIQRIHKANSVRLNKRNTEKMQNFYDVLLRRFMAVGDAIHESGRRRRGVGPVPTTGRVDQDPVQNVPGFTRRVQEPCGEDGWECCRAPCRNVFGTPEFVPASEEEEEDAESAWPGTGTVLLLRALGHIFPVTDLRHAVVTPAVLLLGQMVAQTPVRSLYDLVMGVVCSGLMIEYTKEAKRVAPEALAFLASTVRLFSVDASDENGYALPTLAVASQLPLFQSLRGLVANYEFSDDASDPPKLSLDKETMEDDSVSEAAVGVLCASLSLVETCANSLKGQLGTAEAETFSETTLSLVHLGRGKSFPASGGSLCPSNGKGCGRLLPTGESPCTAATAVGSVGE